MKKKCPKCAGKAVRLYQNKSDKGKRKWIPVAWQCTKCSYLYQVASDTLIYKMGEEYVDDKFEKNCPKCKLKFVRLYRHINPKDGKQQWIPTGFYCSRCKYIWVKKEGM